MAQAAFIILKYYREQNFLPQLKKMGFGTFDAVINNIFPQYSVVTENIHNRKYKLRSLKLYIF